MRTSVPASTNPLGGGSVRPRCGIRRSWSSCRTFTSCRYPRRPRFFSPSFYRNHKASCITQEQEAALPLGIVYLVSELPHDAEHDLLLPLWQASALPEYAARRLIGQGLKHLLVKD